MTMTIEEVLKNEFGATLGTAYPMHIIWAAEYLASHVNYETGKSELRRANEIRQQKGLPLAYAPFGSPVF